MDTSKNPLRLHFRNYCQFWDIKYLASGGWSDFICLRGGSQACSAKFFAIGRAFASCQNRLHFLGRKGVEVKDAADIIIDFHSYVACRNVAFLYVQVPSKENPSSNDMLICTSYMAKGSHNPFIYFNV